MKIVSRWVILRVVPYFKSRLMMSTSDDDDAVSFVTKDDDPYSDHVRTTPEYSRIPPAVLSYSARLDFVTGFFDCSESSKQRRSGVSRQTKNNNFFVRRRRCGSSSFSDSRTPPLQLYT
jgi:hypothetical protein